MTHEEAIENLNYLMSDETTWTQYDCGEEIAMAIDALRKQIPKKPLNTTGYYRDNRCPACNARIKSGCGSSSFYRNNWCNHCGQKIDWEVRNE